jgi:hypothetical protein
MKGKKNSSVSVIVSLFDRTAEYFIFTEPNHDKDPEEIANGIKSLFIHLLKY